MNVEKTILKDCYVLKPNIINDSRGYFYEKYNENTFRKIIKINCKFVQDNISKSSYGVLRGLHFQKGEFAQSKLISCIKGKIWDVAVDLRKESPSFGKYFGIEISEENNLQFFLPRGFAHGFVTLSEIAVLSYKCDNFYNKNAECIIKFDDSDLGIDWKIPKSDIILSEKDKNASYLKELVLHDI